MITIANKTGVEGFALIKIFERMADDERLLATHIGLVAALLFYYHRDGETTGYFQGSRSKLMQVSRIKSIVTYHKCLSDLVSFGYLVYLPSWHPSLGSRFKLVI